MQSWQQSPSDKRPQVPSIMEGQRQALDQQMLGSSGGDDVKSGLSDATAQDAHFSHLSS